MRKHLIPPASELQEATSPPESRVGGSIAIAEVEITSEACGSEIERALSPPGEASRTEGGWLAAGPGRQFIRLHFAHPTRVTQLTLWFEEPASARTQQFVLRWRASADQSWREIVRQQFTFAPNGATTEREHYAVALDAVAMLELEIVPDISGGSAVASLRRWLVQ